MLRILAAVLLALLAACFAASLMAQEQPITVGRSAVEQLEQRYGDGPKLVAVCAYGDRVLDRFTVDSIAAGPCSKDRWVGAYFLLPPMPDRSAKTMIDLACRLVDEMYAATGNPWRFAVVLWGRGPEGLKQAQCFVVPKAKQAEADGGQQ